MTTWAMLGMVIGLPFAIILDAYLERRKEPRQ